MEVADLTVVDFSPRDLLQRLCVGCVEWLDVSAAGVMLADGRGGLQVKSASHGHALLLELVASRRCPDADVAGFVAGEAGTNIDLTDEAAAESWPTFAVLARERGYVRAHSLPLGQQGRVLGVLRLLQRERRVLREDELALAQALADAAAIAVLQTEQLQLSRQENLQLRTALTSRVRVEQGKGFLAARWGTSPDHAFHAMRAYPRTHHLRLTDLATAILNQDFDPSLIPAPSAPKT